MRIARADKNQSEIVNELRRNGFSVQHTHTVGKGCPDIIVGHKKRNVLIEIKEGKGKLTPDEQKFFDKWQGEVYIATNAEQIMKIFDNEAA